MATVRPLPFREEPEPDTLVARLAHLFQLEMELGVAEARELLLSAAIAVAVALIAGITLVASIVMLLAGAMAPLFATRWEPFIISGGFFALVALASIAWSVWRLLSLQWPRETITSFQENWRWLGAQLRSKLTLR